MAGGNNNLDEVIQRLNKQFKYGVRATTAEEAVGDIHRIPFGVAMPDICTGGGVPAGRFTMVYGKRGSGKTYLALRAVANAQKLCRRCFKEKGQCECKKDKKKKEFEPCRVVYVDVEGALNKSWMERLGVDLKQLVVINPVSAEETIDAIREFILQDVMDVLVLDSIAALQPISENERSSVEWTQGLLARLMSRAIRGWLSAMHSATREGRNAPTIIMVNQVRQKIGGYVPTESVPGGMVLGFATTMEIRTWSEKPEMNKTTGKPEWVTLCFETVKNKVGTPFLSGAFRLVVADGVLPGKRAGDVYEEEDVLGLAMRRGAIKYDGKGYECNGQRYNKQEEIIDHWLGNPDEFKVFKERLVTEVLRDGGL